MVSSTYSRRDSLGSTVLSRQEPPGSPRMLAKQRGGVERREARPVDRSITRDERRSLAVREQRVVAYSCHAVWSLALRQTLPRGQRSRRPTPEPTLCGPRADAVRRRPGSPSDARSRAVENDAYRAIRWSATTVLPRVGSKWKGARATGVDGHRPVTRTEGESGVSNRSAGCCHAALGRSCGEKLGVMYVCTDRRDAARNPTVDADRHSCL